MRPVQHCANTSAIGLHMLKSRLQMSIKMQLNLEGMKFKVGDNIKVTNSRLGITEQVFEINSFQLLPSADNGLIVEIEATENASSASGSS